MYGFDKPQPPEIQMLDRKAQTGVELANIIIEFLISESKNPEETKQKLLKMINNNSKLGVINENLGKIGQLLK